MRERGAQRSLAIRDSRRTLLLDNERLQNKMNVSKVRRSTLSGTKLRKSSQNTLAMCACSYRSVSWFWQIDSETV
jgi:hypothetical protein